MGGTFYLTSGPSWEPPIPIATTLVRGLPVAPRWAPERTWGFGGGGVGGLLGREGVLFRYAVSSARMLYMIADIVV